MESKITSLFLQKPKRITSAKPKWREDDIVVDQKQLICENILLKRQRWVFPDNKWQVYNTFGKHGCLMA
jgi:hypothetical protein